MRTRRIILLVLITLLATVPTVNAQPASDQWLIDNAISELKAIYPEYESATFSGVITSGWHTHTSLSAPLHKHVTLTARFGYHDTGYVQCQVRSYDGGGIYIMNHQVSEPDTPKFRTSIILLFRAWMDTDPVVYTNNYDVKIKVGLHGNGFYREYTIRPGRTISVYLPPWISHNVLWEPLF